MGKAVGIFAVIIIILIFIGGWLVNGLNTVVRLNEKVSLGWSQIETQLQRRNDLVPNLVGTVKGYAAHENEIFTEVARLRSRWADAADKAEKIKAAEELGGAISRLLLIAERYPDLKANENFLTLQAQLEGTENRIAVERNRYNRVVKDFNTYIRTVFGSFFAKLRGLNKPAEYFAVEAAAKAAPRVEF